MPDNFERSESTLPKSFLGGSTFTERKNYILKRIKSSAEQCSFNYKGRKELANEKDESVADLLEALDEAFNYGLRHQGNFVVTAASLFQNMQEIVTGNSLSNMSNETSFWDFCQVHLTPHERERFENLKQVWTKAGRGKAFVRATLNENSLHRYFLTWLGDKELLARYYTHWSLLLDKEVSNEMTQIISSLNQILFALNVDAIELNKTVRISNATVVAKEEPIIFAPTPTVQNKRRINAIERPIATASSTEDLIKNLGLTLSFSKTKYEETNGVAENAAEIVETSQLENLPFDPIEPELEFLKQPLPDVYPENQTILHLKNSQSAPDCEDKSDSSSQYSKTSSTNESANCAALEEKLRELNERYALLETRNAQLTLENRQLLRRLRRHFDESGIDPSSSFATNFLITIPTVKLVNAGHATSSYYAYEVHVTMRHHLEHWSVLRRYRDFHKLHKTLLRTHPSMASVILPPKKHFGNKNLVFVEERRQQLQIYLLSLVESLPQVEACKTKVELQKAFPFFRER